MGSTLIAAFGRPSVFEGFAIGSVRLGAVRHGTSIVGRGMAGHADRRISALSISGAARQLQIALEHLRYPMHPTISESATSREHWHPSTLIGINPSVEHHV